MYDYIPGNIVDLRYFTMDPNLHTLIFTGNRIEPGMVILIADKVAPEDPNRQFDLSTAEGRNSHAYYLERLLKDHRWCEVVEVRPDRHNPDVLKFHVRYHDGHEATRSYNESYSWYVLNSSLPNAD